MSPHRCTTARETAKIIFATGAGAVGAIAACAPNAFAQQIVTALQ